MIDQQMKSEQPWQTKSTKLWVVSLRYLNHCVDTRFVTSSHLIQDRHEAGFMSDFARDSSAIALGAQYNSRQLTKFSIRGETILDLTRPSCNKLFKSYGSRYLLLK